MVLFVWLYILKSFCHGYRNNVFIKCLFRKLPFDVPWSWLILCTAKKYLRFKVCEAGYTLLIGLKITPLDSFGLLGVCLITVTGISTASVVDRVAKCLLVFFCWLQLPSMGLYALFWSSALLGRQDYLYQL